MTGLLDDDSGAPTYSKYYYKVKLASGLLAVVCESGKVRRERQKRATRTMFLLT